MLKKVVEKKIEEFKTKFPDHHVSKKTGSLYTKVGIMENKKSVVYTGRAITKGCIAKLGKKVEWTEKKSRFVYLISPKGKLMISKQGGNFGSVSLKTIRHECSELATVYFIGKKFEWLKDYVALWDYKFFQGFNSLGEAKKFLGFSFISDADFIGLFGFDHYDYLSPMILAEDKKNILRLYKGIDSETKDSLRDYIQMCQENDLDIIIPAGVNKLEELHNEAMWKVNEKNAECYSKEYRFDIKEEFTKVWKERNLIFKRLETPFEMYSQGIKQQHCIGTNYATTLHNYAFYTFIFEDKEYDIQIYRDGGIGKFYGRKNKPVPSEFRNKVVKDIKLEFMLVDTKPDLENYPLLKEPNKVNDWLEF